MRSSMTRVLLAVGLAFVLGACSSGNGGNGDAMPSPTEDVQSELDKVKKQLADLMAMGRPADQAEIKRLQGILDATEMQQQAEQMKDDVKMAAALLAGLQGSAFNTGTLTLTPDETISGADAGPSPSHLTVILKATNDVIGSLGSWQGKKYRHGMMNDPVNTAVLYTNKGPGSSVPWLDEYEEGDDGYSKVNNTLTFTGAGMDVFAKVDSSNFDVDSGPKHFKVPGSGVLNISGTYDGASGTYRCTGNGGAICTATVEEKGFTLGGVGVAWTFSPTAGAMVFRADSKYLAFGWWLNDSDMGQMVAPLAHNEGETMASALDEATGTATYMGAAAGKYALRSSLGGVADAGHFTAAATLKADFSKARITGTLDDFMGADGERNWSVDLMEAGIHQTGIFGATFNPDCTKCSMTEWTIDGVSEEKAGTWEGTFYDPIELGKDGARTPMSANGTFAAEYGAIGHMIGAFGAEKQ